ncbi:uncharacterized protein L201_006958 [Kwoniella dendrophila CBS 6074]|uniref:Uncharacterized protein n=1 Tax=Kwoniella dendrophila CBS 6074 TaxID=1295534 RepID=A0AAX4K4F2_9TREE
MVEPPLTKMDSKEEINSIAEYQEKKIENKEDIDHDDDDDDDDDDSIIFIKEIKPVKVKKQIRRIDSPEPEKPRVISIKDRLPIVPQARSTSSSQRATELKKITKISHETKGLKSILSDSSISNTILPKPIQSSKISDPVNKLLKSSTTSPSSSLPLISSSPSSRTSKQVKETDNLVTILVEEMKDWNPKKCIRSKFLRELDIKRPERKWVEFFYRHRSKILDKFKESNYVYPDQNELISERGGVGEEMEIDELESDDDDEGCSYKP